MRSFRVTDVRSPLLVVLASLALLAANGAPPADDDRQGERDQLVNYLGRRGSFSATASGSGAPPPSITGDSGSNPGFMGQRRDLMDAPRINSQKVLQAMRDVPRHWFVPPDMQREAYADRPLPIGFGQTISQPYIVAMMTELLDPKPGEKILEVGTGSGYQAAILTKFTPEVYTVEIVEPLYKQALPRLQKFGLDSERVIHGDGYFGWAKQAPYDGIIVTAAADHIPPPLIEQLKPGGRMVIPIGPVHAAQRLVTVRKDDSGKVRSRTEFPVRFVPLTGGPRGEKK